jgi:holin-like protein
VPAQRHLDCHGCAAPAFRLEHAGRPDRFRPAGSGPFSGLVKARWLQSGTNWLLAEMLLFFVPAMLVVTEYPDLIRHQGLRILAVIVASTACVMAVTALAVDRVYRFELWLARRKSSRDAAALNED